MTSGDNQNAEILAEFITESRETLEKVEPLVIELEQSCAPQGETLAIIFRCFHSFKGTASFLGLEHTASLAHSAESLLDLYRRGAPIEAHQVDLLCRALDTFRGILDVVEVDASDASKGDACRDLAAALDEAVSRTRAHSVPKSPRTALGTTSHHQDSDGATAPVVLPQPWLPSTGPSSAEAAGVGARDARGTLDVDWGESNVPITTEMLTRFVSESEEHLAKVEEVVVGLERGVAGSEDVAEAFRAMHSFKGNCGMCGLSDMEVLTHRAETLLGHFREKTRVPDEQSTSLALEVLDVLRAALAKVPQGAASIPQLPALLERFDALDDKTAQRRRTLAQQRPAPPADATGPTKAAGSIRVDTEKLDALMNLVGELIIAETTVTKNPDLEGQTLENFQKAALHLNRLTRALQDIAMSVRMVPISQSFRKMMRLVRDLGTKQKKLVELVLTGEDTEVDKTVIEAIADPLVHLIRNSIDHGIESQEERTNRGKPPSGKIWLEARHQGGEVWLTVRDDGKGLNTERILAKALERGIAEPHRQYSEREIFDFIFAAGFSTAAQITDVSGRGVGMDVVRRNIEALNGRVEVVSQVGVGTTFTLRIPLTLAIIEGMLVRIGKAHYTIPLLAIRESVKAHPSDITRLHDGKELLKLRRTHYPIIKLAETHRVPDAGTSAMDGTLVVVESGERLACLLVDEVVGQRQTVIKALPGYLNKVRWLAGCSILPNGDISLILDIAGVVGSAESRAA
jgi:two-component system, chemotaxis family, sensor kinase CheA